LKKIQVIIVLLVLGMISVASAQEVKKDSIGVDARGPISFYINNPLGMVAKFRGKLECRFKRNHALLFCITNYYGAYTPGIQTYFEYRKYYGKVNKTESFFYGKSGVGRTKVPYEEALDGYGNYQTNVKVGKYALIGAGIGQSISLGKSQAFYLQFTEGLKCSPVFSGEVYEGDGLKGLFYIAGPGAFIDLGINLGIRF